MLAMSVVLYKDISMRSSLKVLDRSMIVYILKAVMSSPDSQSFFTPIDYIAITP